MSFIAEHTIDPSPSPTPTPDTMQTQPTSLSAAEKGEVEQSNADTSASAPIAQTETNGLNILNGDTKATEIQSNGHAGPAYDLPVRNKESEHNEKMVSAIEDEPADLQANGVVDLDQIIKEREEDGMAMDVVGEAQSLEATQTEEANEPVVEEAQGTAKDITTPAKTPHIPTYLKPTASASSRASPKAKASPARAGAGAASAKPAQAISKLTTTNMRKTSNSTKPPPSDASAAATAEAKLKSPPRAARLSHLTAPTAASAAKRDAAPPASASAPSAQQKQLGRATSVRSRKPVGSAHFLAPTAASSLRKDAPAGSNHVPHATAGSSSSSSPAVQRPASKRTSLATEPANAAGRKVSGSTARPPAPSGSSGAASSKPATGSFLERMTRPTAASAGHKADAARSSPKKSAGASGLGRFNSVRTKGGVPDRAGKKRVGGIEGANGAKNDAPAVSMGGDGGAAEEAQIATNGITKGDDGGDSAIGEVNGAGQEGAQEASKGEEVVEIGVEIEGVSSR